MIILLIPIVFWLVGALFCMGAGGWLALAGALEFFGWATTPKQHRVKIHSGTESFARIVIMLAVILLLGGTIAGLLETRISP
jgi:hypothetical protein